MQGLGQAMWSSSSRLRQCWEGLARAETAVAALEGVRGWLGYQSASLGSAISPTAHGHPSLLGYASLPDRGQGPSPALPGPAVEPGPGPVTCTPAGREKGPSRVHSLQNVNSWRRTKTSNKFPRLSITKSASNWSHHLTEEVLKEKTSIDVKPAHLIMKEAKHISVYTRKSVIIRLR